MNNVLTLSPPISIKRHLSLPWMPPTRHPITLKTCWILSLILIITLLAFYIIQINRMTNEAYLIQNYERELNKLSQGNETLKISSAQTNSLGNIEGLIKELGFEKIGQIYYIQVLESQIVTK